MSMAAGIFAGFGQAQAENNIRDMQYKMQQRMMLYQTYLQLSQKDDIPKQVRTRLFQTAMQIIPYVGQPHKKMPKELESAYTLIGTGTEDQQPQQSGETSATEQNQQQQATRAATGQQMGIGQGQGMGMMPQPDFQFSDPTRLNPNIPAEAVGYGMPAPMPQISMPAPPSSSQEEGYPEFSGNMYAPGGMYYSDEFEKYRRERDLYDAEQAKYRARSPMVRESNRLIQDAGGGAVMLPNGTMYTQPSHLSDPYLNLSPGTRVIPKSSIGPEGFYNPPVQRPHLTTRTLPDGRVERVWAYPPGMGGTQVQGGGGEEIVPTGMVAPQYRLDPVTGTYTPIPTGTSVPPAEENIERLVKLIVAAPDPIAEIGKLAPAQQSLVLQALEESNSPLWAEEKRIAKSLIDMLEDMAVGEKGLFKGREGISAYLQGKVDPAMAALNLDEPMKVYLNTIDSNLGRFARAAGQRGNLSEFEQLRQKLMFPMPGDSEKAAQDKFLVLRAILSGAMPSPFATNRLEAGEDFFQ